MKGNFRKIIMLMHFSPDSAMFNDAVTLSAQQQTQIHTSQNHILTETEAAKELLVREVSCVPILETSKAVQSALCSQPFHTLHN